MAAPIAQSVQKYASVRLWLSPTRWNVKCTPLQNTWRQPVCGVGGTEMCNPGVWPPAIPPAPAPPITHSYTTPLVHFSSPPPTHALLKVSLQLQNGGDGGGRGGWGRQGIRCHLKKAVVRIGWKWSMTLFSWNCSVVKTAWPLCGLPAVKRPFLHIPESPFNGTLLSALFFMGLISALSCWGKWIFL